MNATDRERLRLLHFAGAALFSLYRGGLYFVSFLGPFLLIKRFWFLPAPALLALMLLGFGVAGFVFLSLLVLTRKLLIASAPATGLTTVLSKNGRRWFSAALTTTCLVHSPFRPMTSGLSLLACWYYRGMGARMPNSVLLGAGSRITDPWFVEVGENAVIGADAVILGHLGHGEQIVLGRVVIGVGVVVGMRAVIFPDVRIGHYARVGAGAVVTRGTTIPDGETWAGIPARKISVDSQEKFDEIGTPVFTLSSAYSGNSREPA
jgi:acetyltransferase-like isoleucine patch superfamily enzyme